VKFKSFPRNAITKLGTIAIPLVINALRNLDTLILIKPDITNYPASVPVSVEDYPAASKPIPHMILAVLPN
jgi:hypothetical protein